MYLVSCLRYSEQSNFMYQTINILKLNGVHSVWHRIHRDNVYGQYDVSGIRYYYIMTKLYKNDLVKNECIDIQ